jgi:hypothetical protein
VKGVKVEKKIIIGYIKEKKSGKENNSKGFTER